MTELQVNVIFRSNPMTATVGQIGQSRNLSQHPLPLTAEFLGLKPAFISGLRYTRIFRVWLPPLPREL